jgi:C-terminal processing protease CtpA/Prc
VHDIDPIDELGAGIRYVDLRRTDWSDISRSIEELAAAPAVIFDLRGYPNANHDILSHLTDQTLQSAIWNKPQIVYPDQEDVTGWDQSGRWLMPPREPRFQGQIVFITDASAISYAESVMGIVEHYNLGRIVGEATAGANGNVNWITLPGNIRIIWTGMKVLKHDGSQHHLIGIQPTIPVKRTIEGVSAGVDELLEAAIRSVDVKSADRYVCLNAGSGTNPDC